MAMQLLPVLLLFAAIGGRAEVIDRVAVVVENRVITESAILQEIRLEAFQNGTSPDFSPVHKRKVADRLLERMLIAREMEYNHYAQPTAVENQADLAELRRRFPNEKAYKDALTRYGVNETELLDHLMQQRMTISFIDVRFRPAVQVSDEDLREYYLNQYVPRWKETHKGEPPTLDAVREEMTDAITQARVDQSLDRWMGETRTQLRIRFRPEVFR